MSVGSDKSTSSSTFVVVSHARIFYLSNGSPFTCLASTFSNYHQSHHSHLTFTYMPFVLQLISVPLIVPASAAHHICLGVIFALLTLNFFHVPKIFSFQYFFASLSLSLSLSLLSSLFSLFVLCCFHFISALGRKLCDPVKYNERECHSQQPLLKFHACFWKACLHSLTFRIIFTIVYICSQKHSRNKDKLKRFTRVCVCVCTNERKFR